MDVKILCCMSLHEKENFIMPLRICLSTAADNANINLNNVRLIKKKVKQTEMKCILERIVDFNSKKIRQKLF